MGSNLLAVALGGAAGSVLRYFIQRQYNLAFPLGTLSVNLLGCLLIGLLWGLFEKEGNEPLRLFLVTGFCGGFTTFSAFTQESLTLLSAHRWPAFFLYISVSIIGGLLATFAGFKLTS